MTRTTATRRIEWDAAHRVLRHESKCATLHGHRYAALVTVEADVLDDLTRVVDFGVIKTRVGGWVDRAWDHNVLVNRDDTHLLEFARRDAELRRLAGRDGRMPYVFDGEPTAEAIAAVLLSRATCELGDIAGLRVVSVEVFETPTCSARAERPWRG
jgi:6-pyruvoyltetrahydropterin/6-carboxytetrahydropterin synthase